MTHNRGSPTSVQERKSQLRRQVRSELQRLSPASMRDASERVSARLLGEPSIRSTGTVMAFLSDGTIMGEVDVGSFVAAHAARGGRVALAAVDWKARELRPLLIADAGAQGLGRVVPVGRGVLGPAPGCPSVEPESLDVVLVPGLAFDARGGRLGRGAGFYDRFLPAVGQRCVRIGVCMDEQIVPHVPTEPFDAPVDLVVTPTTRLDCAFHRSAGVGRG